MKHNSLPIIMCLLQLVLEPCTLASGETCDPPSPSLSTLQREAVFIGDIVYRDSRQSLFPSIRFTCNGAITKWTMVGSEVGGGTRYPQFSVWRNTGGNNWERVAHNRLTESDRTDTPFVYEKTLTQPLEFEAGYILGVYTPPAPKLSFKHQRDGGETNYYIGGIAEQRSTFDTSGSLSYAADDVPLLTVESTNPECVTGLIDRDTLLIKAGILDNNVTDVHYREATQRVIPALAFPCRGKVVKFTVAALRELDGGSRYPELQVWRAAGESQWVKEQAISSEAAIVRTDSLNVLQYIPLPPLPVEEGDILGIYQPYSSASQLKIYLRDDGPANYYRIAQLSPADTFTANGLASTESRMPLVTMEISVEGTTTTVYPSLTSTPTPLTSTPSPPTTHSPTSTELPLTSSPFTQITHTPSPTHTLSPTHTPSKGQVEEGLVVAVVIIAVLLVVCAAVIVVLGVGLFKRQRETLQIHVKKRKEATNPVADLDYNPTYNPRNPADIIQDGRRHTLTLTTNTAYSSKAEKPAAQGSQEHIYESIPT